MRTLDAIARILKIEGIENLSAFPTTALIEAAADIGIKPVIFSSAKARRMASATRPGA